MAGVMLDQDAGETLELPEHGAVDHHRDGLRAVLPDIKGAEPIGMLEIDLDRSALPVAADGVPKHIFQLRTVKCALARTEVVCWSAASTARLSAASALSHTSSEPTRLSGRSANLMITSSKAEIAIDRQDQLVQLHAFFGDLILGTEDMRVVLSEMAHAHDPVQCA